MTSSSSSKAQRILIVGLDGANPETIQRLASEGHMPFLRSVLERGVFGSLQSVFPPLTPPAWATFMTGRNPGKHGIFEFSSYQGYDRPLRVNNATDIQGQTLWSILSRAGKRLFADNVPMTYPPQPVSGEMICAFLLPNTDVTFTHPPSLYQELKPQLGDYVAGVNSRHYSRLRLGRFLRDLEHCTRQRTRYVQALMQRQAWDLGMVVFYENDMLQHTAWSFLDPEDRRENNPRVLARIHQYLKLLDASIEQICTDAGPQTQVMVLSDHGFGPLHKWVHINTWLAERGLLAYEPRQVQRVRRVLGLKSAVRALDVLDLSQRLPWSAGKRCDLPGFIRWDQTKAFAILTGEQGIRINLRGRESQGTVEPGQEYEALRDRIIAELGQLRDPETGRLLRVQAHRREELYKGPRLEQASDVVFLIEDGAYIASVMPGRHVFQATDWVAGSGTHRLAGMFAACGPGIVQGAALQNAKLEDVMPSILYAMGLPIPDDVDGRVLTEIFTPAFQAGRSVRFDAAVSATHEQRHYSTQEEEQVIARLKALGYVQ